MDKLVIMFPDFEGKESAGEFGQQLKALQLPAKNTVFIPVLNGTYPALLKSRASLLKGHFDPIISFKKGLRAALEMGYQKIVKKYPDAVVVRLDTKEHDIRFIRTLAEKAVGIKGMVIGNLIANQKAFIRGTIDWFADTLLFPELYTQFTEGKLSLSGSHGFQAFAPRIVPKIFATAQKILKIAQKEGSASSYFWGLDGAMALAAHKLKIKTVISPIPACIVRNRDVHKIISQFSAHLSICRAFVKA